MDGGAMDGPPPKDSNAHQIYIPVAIFFAISPLMVIIRALCHKKARGTTGLDDLAMLTGLFAALASGVIMILGCKNGYGQHWANLTPSQQRESLKYFYACQITYKISINSTKFAILLLYRRIFHGNWRFRRVCDAGMVVVGCWVIASTVATVFQCTPVVRSWDKSVPGTCINNLPFWYANAWVNIGTDAIILLMPLPLVYLLKIPNLQKVGLAMVFCLGIFVTITSALRFTTINMQATTNDKTYDVISTMWTIVEMNMAIVCACLPQTRPMMGWLSPKLVQLYRRFCSPILTTSSDARDYARGGVRLKTPSFTDSVGATAATATTTTTAQQSLTPSEADEAGQELYTLRVIQTYHQ